MTGLIILAAGSSSRLGYPKQNINFNGKSLLQRAAETAMRSTCKPVIVVLGANAAEIEPSLNIPDVYIVKNDNWAEGMSSSIQSGLSLLQTINPATGAVVLMLCDQPFVEGKLIDQLIEAKKNSTKKIIACSYNDTVGPPALFDATYFPDLLLLKGQDGAKKLLLQFQNDVDVIPFDMGSVDIDTREDHNKLKDYNKS